MKTYAKFGSNSDVHLYRKDDGTFVCSICKGLSEDKWEDFSTKEGLKMRSHLKEHVKLGHRIPYKAYQAIEKDIREEIFDEYLKLSQELGGWD